MSDSSSGALRTEPFGWTPLLWLAFLPTFLIEPVVRTQTGAAGATYWAATIAALGLFLPTYLAGYRPRQRHRGVIVAVHAALGAGFAPFNAGSSVFFVYAAAVGGQHRDERAALALVLAAAGAGAVTAWLAGPPGFFWIAAVPVTLVVGGVHLHVARFARAQREIRLARQEIERLVALNERDRIARDLHDVLGHTLSLIGLKAQLARRTVSTEPGRADRELEDIEQTTRSTLRAVRRAIDGYRPSLADEVRSARKMLDTAGIAASVGIDSLPMAPAAAEALAWALREAVTNVARHSEATVCRLRLHEEQGMAVLSITDDGLGHAGEEGMGMRGMRERVEELGGSIERNGSRGTRVVVRVPLAPALRPSTADVRGAAG